MDQKEYRRKQVMDRCRIKNAMGLFEFKHSGRGYWIVTGRVPLMVAQQIYMDPASDQIRVDGHCMAPAPEDPWIKWRMPDCTELGTLEDLEAIEKLPFHGETFHKEYLSGFTFSNDPEVRARAKPFVELYHIDSDLGLRVFVDYLRWYKLI